MKILFVCLGNICRSPIAEGVMRSLIQEQHLNWQIDSASTNTFHTGESPHKHSQQVCKEQGICISQQQSRRIQQGDLEKYDKIYYLAKDVLHEMKNIIDMNGFENKIKLFLTDLYPHESCDVKDPWYGGLDGYYPVFDEIKLGCMAILKKELELMNN